MAISSRIYELLKNQRIAVLGLGISNRPLLHFLADLGLAVTAFDVQAADSAEALTLAATYAKNPAIRFVWGPDYLEQLHGFDVIFRTPRIQPHEPALIAERRRGAILCSEMELFMQFCPAPIIAITGSDGKTTSSTLTAELLKAAGYHVWLGGNIGQPLLAEIDRIKADDRVVLELSSFQLADMQISPQRALITNISPNHLDVHKDYAEYVNAKKNIFRHQRLGDLLVLNGEDKALAESAAEAKCRVIWSGCRPFGDQAAYCLEGEELRYYPAGSTEGQVLLTRSEIKIPGRHNALNYLNALALTDGWVQAEYARTLARNFGGVEHRIEWIREIDGVPYYNSSIDSSPTRTKATLASFQERGQRVVLITGGKDKNSDYRGLGRAILATCQAVCLYGQNSPLILKNLQEEAAAEGKTLPPCHCCEDYTSALQAARTEAKAGMAVLLSPAGTSFDHYRNFMERGEHFKELVRAL